jgi:hypothetical protein
MFTCNLQGKYVTSVLYSRTGDDDVFLWQLVNFANAIIPKSAMLAENTNCVIGLTKNNGATSLGDLTGLPKYYWWNVGSGCGSPSTFPEY